MDLRGQRGAIGRLKAEERHDPIFTYRRSHKEVALQEDEWRAESCCVMHVRDDGVGGEKCRDESRPYWEVNSIGRADVGLEGRRAIHSASYVSSWSWRVEAGATYMEKFWGGGWRSFGARSPGDSRLKQVPAFHEL